MRRLIFTLASLVCAASLALGPRSVAAGADTLAHQRVLVDQMSFAACMVMANLNPKTNTALALKAASEFHGLLTQDPARGESIAAAWQRFGPAVQQIASQDFHTVVMGQFLAQRAPLANRIAQQLSTQQVSSGKAQKRVQWYLQQLAILSQSLGTDVCLIGVKVDTTRAAAKLAEQIGIFEERLTALEYGDTENGIPTPTDMEFEDSLWMLRGEWDALSDLLKEITVATGVSRDDLVMLSEAIGVLYVACEDTRTLHAQANRSDL